MLQAPMARVKAASAAEVCENFALKKEAQPLLGKEQSPREVLEVLLAKKQNGPAVDFLAHALPPREAIWWGCLCLQAVSGSGLSPMEAAAWKAAVAWVLDPTEQTRCAAR